MYSTYMARSIIYKHIKIGHEIGRGQEDKEWIWIEKESGDYDQSTLYDNLKKLIEMVY